MRAARLLWDAATILLAASVVALVVAFAVHVFIDARSGRSIYYVEGK